MPKRIRRLPTTLFEVDLVSFGADAQGGHPGGVTLPHRMDDARPRATIRTDGGHVAPDHAVRPLDELRFGFRKRSDPHRLLQTRSDRQAAQLASGN
jgi:hypothetical protein